MTQLEKLMKLNHVTSIKKSDPIKELNAKLDAILESQEIQLNQIDSHQFEVVKPNTPTGDYLDPILFVAPMDIENGKFYYTEEVGKDMPREAIKYALQVESFDSRVYFDWV